MEKTHGSKECAVSEDIIVVATEIARRLQKIGTYISRGRRGIAYRYKQVLPSITKVLQLTPSFNGSNEGKRLFENV